MAKSGWCNITRNWGSDSANRSSIHVDGIIQTSGESYRGTHRTGTYTVTQDGTVVASGSFTSGAPANSTTTLFSIDFEIAHYANGSSGTIAASYNYDGGWCTGSGSASFQNTVAVNRTISQCHNYMHDGGYWVHYHTNTHTVKDGGTFTPYNDTTNLPAGYSPGNNFNWYIGGVYSGDGTVGVDSITGITSDMTVNVHYYRTTYTVSYNANGGSGAPGAQTKTWGTNLTLSSTIPTRANYTFLGWSTTSTGGVQYNAGGTYTANAGVTLYAVWQLNSFGFDLNGRLDGNSAGSISPYGIVDVYMNGSLVSQNVADYATYHYYGTTYQISNIRANTGYSYDGVHSGSLSGTITGNTEVVLKFSSKQYTYEINPNGGKFSNGVTTTATADPNLIYNSSNWYNSSGWVPSRVGYNFLGLYTTASGTGTEVFDASGMCVNGSGYWTDNRYVHDGNLTVYARWQARTDTKYKVEHYKENANDNDYTLADTQNLTGTSDASITPAVKTYTGFNSPATQTTTISADGSRVVKYYYTRKKYALTLSKGTGISSVSGAATYKYGQSVTVDATLSTGYVFTNWKGTFTSTNKQYTFKMPNNEASLVATGELECNCYVKVGGTYRRGHMYIKSDGTYKHANPHVKSNNVYKKFS